MLFFPSFLLSGGEGGIRTLEASLHPPNRLAGGPFRPLKHLSEFYSKQYNNTDFIKKYICGFSGFILRKKVLTVNYYLLNFLYNIIVVSQSNLLQLINQAIGVFAPNFFKQVLALFPEFSSHRERTRQQVFGFYGIK